MLHFQLPAAWTIDLVLLAVNLALASWAAAVNFHEARHGFRQFRWGSWWRAGLAVVYCLSYLLLTFTNVDRTVWSHGMIGVSPMAWFVVWVLPSRRQRALREAMVDDGVTTIVHRPDRARAG